MTLDHDNNFEINGFWTWTTNDSKYLNVYVPYVDGRTDGRSPSLDSKAWRPDLDDGPLMDHH